MITKEQIKVLAHAIWEQEGKPGGKDAEHYLHAKIILEEREKTGVIELLPPPPIPRLSPPLTTTVLEPSKRLKHAPRKKRGISP